MSELSYTNCAMQQKINNQKVIVLPASVNFTPTQALDSASQMGATDVLIVGYDDEENLFIRSSKMSRADAVFLLEKAKQWALGGGNE